MKTKHGVTSCMCCVIMSRHYRMRSVCVCVCKELFFLPSSLHYYDNTFISASVASAVFSTEKPLQH